MLRIEVDRDCCIGAGVCISEAFNTFGIDEGQLVYVKDPKGNDDESIVKAAEGCPVSAIRLYNLETGEKIFPKE